MESGTVYPYRTLKLTKPSVAALPRGFAAERQSFGGRGHRHLLVANELGRVSEFEGDSGMVSCSRAAAAAPCSKFGGASQDRQAVQAAARAEARVVCRGRARGAALRR
jgi:hypothetical protein